MPEKRTVPQSVFDSPDAIRVSKRAHREACEELVRTPVHLLNVGNPNHPIHDGLFGYATADFLAKQNKESHK